jgi:hypothetical protein
VRRDDARAPRHGVDVDGAHDGDRRVGAQALGVAEHDARVVPGALRGGGPAGRVERVVEALARALRRRAEVHREARRDDEVARHGADAELVQLARDGDGVLVVEGGVAPGDDEVAVDGGRRLVERAGHPERGGEAVARPEGLERGQRRRELDGRGRVEALVGGLLADDLAVQTLDEHALVREGRALVGERQQVFDRQLGERRHARRLDGRRLRARRRLAHDVLRPRARQRGQEDNEGKNETMRLQPAYSLLPSVREAAEKRDILAHRLASERLADSGGGRVTGATASMRAAIVRDACMPDRHYKRKATPVPN